MTYLKYILLLFSMLAAILQAQENTRIIGTWQSDHLIGEKIQKPDDYILSFPNTILQQKAFGNKIVFSDDGIFTSKEISWCGFGSYPTIEGRYEVIDKNKIQLYLTRYYSSMSIGQINRYIDHDLGTYRIEELPDRTFKLIFTPNGTESNDLKRAKRIIQNLKPTINTDQEWKGIDASYRNAGDRIIFEQILKTSKKFSPEKTELIHSQYLDDYLFKAFIFKYKEKFYVGLYTDLLSSQMYFIYEPEPDKTINNQ